jgi:hypothetical protein
MTVEICQECFLPFRPVFAECDGQQFLVDFKCPGCGARLDPRFDFEPTPTAWGISPIDGAFESLNDFQEYLDHLRDEILCGLGLPKDVFEGKQDARSSPGLPEVSPVDGINPRG